MAVSENDTIVSAVIPKAANERLVDIAKGIGVSKSKIIATLINVSEDFEFSTRKVRSNNKELFISLPVAFINATHLQQGDEVVICYTENELTITSSKKKI